MGFIVFDVIVAAGGYGTRLNVYKPKSRLEVAGKTLLDHVIYSLRSVNPRKIIICCGEDRAWYEWVEKSYIGTANAVFSNSNQSSLALVQSRTGELAERILFLYGHAPRPASHIEKLINTNFPFSATSVWSSSRRDPIKGSGGRYLEPPFFFYKRVLAPYHHTWKSVLKSCKSRELSLNGPGEFNEENEFLEYVEYLNTIDLFI